MAPIIYWLMLRKVAPEGQTYIAEDAYFFQIKKMIIFREELLNFIDAIITNSWVVGLEGFEVVHPSQDLLFLIKSLSTFADINTLSEHKSDVILWECSHVSSIRHYIPEVVQMIEPTK